MLLANCATVNTKMIDTGIKKILNKNKKFDSAVSTSIYNMWSPLRARKLIKDGTLKPLFLLNLLEILKICHVIETLKEMFILQTWVFQLYGLNVWKI